MMALKESGAERPLGRVAAKPASHLGSPSSPNHTCVQEQALSASIYENGLPPRIEAEMDQLYGALYSSAAYFRTACALDGTKAYVVRRGSVVQAVFLFQMEGDTLRVINEGMQLESEAVEAFVRDMFRRHLTLRAVRFRAVRLLGPALRLSHQRFFCIDGYVVSLPTTAETYLASLGASTRKNIKRHKNRIERDFPSFRFRRVEGAVADEMEIRAIIELNRARMASKNKESAIDEQTADEIVRLTKACGQLYLATIDDQIGAGAIVFRIGHARVSRVNAHASQYDDHRLGTVCCYLAICDAIEQGASSFDLGHGRYEYKTALRGEPLEFDSLVIYRSRWQMLRLARLAFSTAKEGYRVQARRWLINGLQHGQGVFWSVAGKALRLLKTREARRGRS